jgi:hypothetical protein
MLRFEHKSQPLLHWPHFLQRLILSFALGVLLVLVSLLGGMLGYHYLEKLAWLDAFANAAMILSGMGAARAAANAGRQALRGVVCALQRAGRRAGGRHHLCARRPSLYA